MDLVLAVALLVAGAALHRRMVGAACVLLGILLIGARVQRNLAEIGLVLGQLPAVAWVLPGFLLVVLSVAIFLTVAAAGAWLVLGWQAEDDASDGDNPVDSGESAWA